jgi:two-component system OmpR family sensor kinase
VSNLLNNARRHTPAGTTVTVVLRTDERQAAILTVHDNGPGIPADLQANVFKRFTRADASRTRDSGGSGLGLSLVQSITQGHGGTITVSSSPGNTCFTVGLPWRPGPPGHHNQPPTIGVTLGASSRRQL